MIRFALLSVYCLLLLPGCKSPLAAFSWLEGHWSMARPKGGERLELWQTSSPYLMEGKGLKVTGTDTALLESIQLTAKGKSIYYIPTVPDQNEAKPVPFKMSSYTDQTVTFENAAHDFPQRIVYRFQPASKSTLADADSIYVVVESLDGQGINYAFRRK